MSEPADKVPVEPEASPVFGTWGRWYAVVLIELAVVVIGAYLLTEAYR
jgi:hypothetical protein